MNNDFTGQTISYFIVKKDGEIFNPQRIYGLSSYNVESLNEATRYDDEAKAKSLADLLNQFAVLQDIEATFEIRKSIQTLSVVE